MKLVLPAWLAAIVQVPAVKAVTVVPLIVQTPVVLLLRLTVRPDVAVALTVPVPLTARLGAVPKLMLWFALPTPMSSVIVLAGLKFALPPWLAWIVHVPPISGVTVVPEIVQTVGVVLVSVTARPEVAVAVTVASTPTASVGAAPKLMLWLAAPTVMLWLTAGAAL